MKSPLPAPGLCAALLAVLLTGCGGGSEETPAGEPSASLLPSTSTSPATTDPASATPAPTGPATPTTSTPVTSSALPPLPMPSGIGNGSVVELECGRLYQGTLDLEGKADVTVRTGGSCGNAILSPGQALAGWTRHEGDVFSAAVPFDVAQVALDGQPQELAHWPNRPQTWARATSSSASSLTYAMPNADLTGATLVFKPYVWAVEARRISGYANDTMSLASTGDINFDGYALGGAVEFYVEGKLWMLDAPGEWAVRDGRLYVWTPDGRSPEGRVWVSPRRDGIDASNSQRVALEGVTVHGAANGVNALNASALRATNVKIVNASANGILNSGGSGLVVEGSEIRNVRHDAIAIKWGGGSETIRNNRIDASGSIGMPTNAHAAVNVVASSGASVYDNQITRSGYIGIRAFRNALVSNNTIDGACLVLTDCGGIAVSSPDKSPLNTRIENNTIRNVGADQRLAWGVYLSDGSNVVTVAGNAISASGNGLEILNGFNNRITGNTFSSNTQAHIQMVEFGSAPVVQNNVVSGNTFTTAGKEEMYRLSSELGTQALARFASYSDNNYVSSSSIFANYNGEALSFAQWKTRTGQDADSTLQTVP